MRKIISLFALAISLINCKAQQQIYPLNTYYEDAPNYAYMKDLNNYLPPYVGIYKATFEDNEITLFITKEDKVLKDYGSGDRKFYRDILRIKYTIKKISTGTILQDTQTSNSSDPTLNRIISMGTNENDNHSVSLYYDGTTCGIGWGRITLKKISSTQISWSYFPNDSLFSGNECPNSNSIKVYLPDTENLIFTKQ
ncbi:DUF6705 family protein [Chryseobacterium daeguense]|uniref:DUF6705 family protein n=1 Tax=Chryseobacterium daeguense TaxID=412438 RepID=UPI000411FAF7|nr:hypothetical protein [Chryseobacterium daeguense]